MLEPDELTVGMAYARLKPILDRLTEAPFDRTAYADLITYLDDDAWAATEAFDRLAARGATHLQTRLASLEHGDPR